MGMCVSKAGMFIPPLVEVKSIEFQGISLSGVIINVALEVKNPNLGTINAKSIEYKLQKASDNTLLAQGTYPKFTIPALETFKTTIPITFTYMGIGAAGKSLILRKQTTVVVLGDVTVEAPLLKEKEVKVPFSMESTIAIDANAKVSSQNKTVY